VISAASNSSGADPEDLLEEAVGAFVGDAARIVWAAFVKHTEVAESSPVS
jgi:hypothetical protein